MIVAIDGPAGVGKSTVAKRVAETLDFYYLNSGNFYRVITLAHIRSGELLADTDKLIDIARDANIAIVNSRICLDSRDVEDGLHTDAVDEWVAQHSAVVEVRHLVNAKLREATREIDSVIEGRDIATVVYPDAEVKVYMDASVKVRARRRFLQGTSTKSLAEIADNIAMRDNIDRNKAEGSLSVAEGALYLDTSDLTIDEVCDRVIRKIQEAELV
ncbi:MAG: cytidylate kinase [Spirochaetales bacterium]|nr:cytidylate kinase [Spirochaetales bacterium]